MSFDWKEYLNLAKKLAAEKSNDAALRSAISRSYYCVFNLAMQRAEANQFKAKDDASSHDQLWSLYARNKSDATCVRLASIGPRLKRRRVKADYRHYVNRLHAEVEEAITDAEECLALIAALKPDMPQDLARSWSF
jgi:hypothetical protein